MKKAPQIALILAGSCIAAYFIRENVDPQYSLGAIGGLVSVVGLLLALYVNKTKQNKGETK